MRIRIENFFKMHLILFIPISFILFQIENLQPYYDTNLKAGGFILFYVLGSYIFTSFSAIMVIISVFTFNEISDSILYIAIIYVPLIMLFLTDKFLNKKVGKILILSIYISITILMPVGSLSPILTALILAYSLYEHLTPRKKCFVVYDDGETLGFFELLNRNLLKIAFLTVLPIPLIFYLIKKETPWDTICGTKVILTDNRS